MKKTKFSEAQIAFALKEAEDGTSVGEVCRLSASTSLHTAGTHDVHAVHSSFPASEASANSYRDNNCEGRSLPAAGKEPDAKFSRGSATTLAGRTGSPKSPRPLISDDQGADGQFKVFQLMRHAAVERGCKSVRAQVGRAAPCGAIGPIEHEMTRPLLLKPHQQVLMFGRGWRKVFDGKANC